MAKGDDLVKVSESSHPRYAWRTTWTEGGKRGQSFHKSKADAEAAAREVRERLRDHGAAEEAISRGERAGVLRWRTLALELEIPEEVRLVDVVEEFVECRTLIQDPAIPEGVRLADIAREFVTWRRLAIEHEIPEGVRLADVVREFGVRHKKERESRPLGEAVASYIDFREKEGKSRRHLDDLRLRLGRLVREMGAERRLAMVTGEDVDEWLAGLGVTPVTVLNYRRAVMALFSHGVKKKWCKENPVCHAHRPKVARTTPGILTPRQLAGLLAECEGELLAVVVLGAFCGLRPSEALAMRWENIQMAEGIVRIYKSKTEDRDAPITPAAAAWLVGLHKGEGAVASFSVWGYMNRLKRASVAAGIEEWPSNALRHSFASYRLKLTNDRKAVAEEMGNTPQVLRTNYRRLVSEDEARAWFNVLPKGRVDNVVPMVARR
jgi:integrase